MSNHLAIATVTATLQRTLQSSIQKEFEGARITTLSPNEIGKGTPETGVNIFMYQVITNPALHNADVSPMRSRGSQTKRQVALDLYYMLSCYGNNNELAPQRLMGSVVQAMNDRRVITQEMIQDACQDATLTFLKDSNLANQVQKISMLPLDLNLEDLSKTWSVFFQTPYILSVAYKSLVVMVDGREALAHALPIRNYPSSGLSTFAVQPYVERAIAKSGKADPIFANSSLLIKGKQLQGTPKTQVRIGTVEGIPTAVSAHQIELSLAAFSAQSLRAGVQTLQVIHPLTGSDADVAGQQSGPESNGVPVIIRPRIVQAQADQVKAADDDLCDAEMSVQVDLGVAPRQKVVLSLSEWWSPKDERWEMLKAQKQTNNTRQDNPVKPPMTYLFEGTQRETMTSTIDFSCCDIKPGEYLVRILIDGAESPLQTDTTEWLDPATKKVRNPQFNWYIGPRLTVGCPDS